jgi:hypothetical protein
MNACNKKKESRTERKEIASVIQTYLNPNNVHVTFNNFLSFNIEKENGVLAPRKDIISKIDQLGNVQGLHFDFLSFSRQEIIDNIYM